MGRVKRIVGLRNLHDKGSGRLWWVNARWFVNDLLADRRLRNHR